MNPRQLMIVFLIQIGKFPKKQMLKRRGQVNLSELQTPNPKPRTLPMQTTDEPQTAYDRVPYPDRKIPKKTNAKEKGTGQSLRTPNPKPQTPNPSHANDG